MISVKAIGISTPPLKPWKARSTIIWLRSWASAHDAEKARKSAAFTSR